MRNIGYCWLEPLLDSRYNENIKDWEYLFYNFEKKKWEYCTCTKAYSEKYEYAIYCKTLKAAKRHLRKHNEIPRGTIFRLESRRIDGPDVWLTKR